MQVSKVAVALTLTMVVMGLVLAVSPVAATTVSECQAAINVVVTDTQAASSLSAKDEAGLVGKAQNAALKLDQGKFADALQKLIDFQTSLNALHLAAKPKVSEADFATLSADIDAAITCVQHLISGT